MNRNAFDWKDFVNTKLTLDNYNFDKIENLELYNDEYKRIAFLSHNFVNYDRSCNINNINNNNNNKKTNCSNFSNILNKCETEYLGPEVKTYNCEKFLLLLRSPLIEPLFMAQTPDLLLKKNYNMNQKFEFDFKKEFKKLGFYDALIKEAVLEETYRDMEVNDINGLVALFSLLINKIEPINNEDYLSEEDEDVKNNNNMLEEAFDVYVNKFVKNELQGGGIGSFVKKNINRIAIVGLGCIYYTIKMWMYVSLIIAAVGLGILAAMAVGSGGKIGWGEATFIGDATTEISKQTQVKNYYTGRSIIGNIIHYGGVDLKKAFYKGDLGLINKNINLRIIAFSIITYVYVMIIDTNTNNNNDFIEITLDDIINPANIGLKEKEKEKFILGIRKSFYKYLNNDVDYKLLNTYLKKFFNYNERKITSYYIKIIDDKVNIFTNKKFRDVNGKNIITYNLKQSELPSSFQNIPNINNCEIISINGEKDFTKWRATIINQQNERKYNLVTLYNPNPLPYKVVKGTRQLQVE